jgi:hypothetical protein
MGFSPFENSSRWSYGYGFGSEFALGKHFDLNLDLMCNQIHENSKSWTEDLNLVNQLKVSVGWKPGKRTAIYGGPLLHVAVSKVKNNSEGGLGTKLIPDNAFFDEVEGKTRVAMWPGFHAGLRF